MAKVGRNEPCPCGSGKKFKKCCLQGPAEPRVQLDAADRAMELAIEWLLERYPQDIEAAVEHDFVEYLQASQFEDFLNLPADILQLASINAYEWALAEGWARPENDTVPLLDLVLGVGGPLMAAEQRQFLSKLGQSALNLYEVVAAKEGQSIQIRELMVADPAGEATIQWVSAPMLSRGELAKPGTVIGLRVIPGDPPRITDATYYFPGSWTAGVLNALRQNVDKHPHPDDRQFAFSAPIISQWLSILTAKPPTLVDQSTGNSILMVTDHYRIEDEDALSQRLEEEPDVVYDEENGWVRLRERADGSRSPLISLYKGKKAGTLEVFGRTQAYADDGKAWLQEVAADALTFITREISDPLSLADSAAQKADTESVDDLMSSFSADQLSEIISNHYRQTYAHWADEPLPALDERTPREMVESSLGRRRVIDLLDSYDRNEQRMAAEHGRETLSFDFLRQEVGLLPKAET